MSEDTPLPESGVVAKPSAMAAFGNANYRRYFAGATVSMLGRQMLLVAIGWDIYDKTHSAMALGYIGLSEVIPVILLTLVAGHAADTYSRKRIIQGAQLLFSVTIFGIAVASYWHVHLIWIYALLFLYGVAKSFASPANGAILPQVIPHNLLANALTWNTMTNQIASILGPTLAGLLIGWQKSALVVYLISACCALIFFLLMSGITETFQKNVTDRAKMSLKSLSAGLHYVWNTKVVLSAITLDLFAVLLGGAVALLPIFAHDILHVGPVGLGFLQAAPALGSMLMAVFLTRRPITRHTGLTMLACVAGFGLATIGFGLSRMFPLSFVMLCMLGALDNVSMVVRSMLIQFQTPRHLLGRVSAINYVFIGTSNELGGFESGLVAHFFGPIISVVSGGVGTILVTLAVAMLWPQMRRLDKIRNLNAPSESA